MTFESRFCDFIAPHSADPTATGMNSQRERAACAGLLHSCNRKSSCVRWIAPRFEVFLCQTSAASRLWAMAAAMSNVALLEHVNINMPADGAATVQRFFVDGLGCALDPRPAEWGKSSRLLWFNTGLSQFHVPLIDPATQPDVAPQKVRGLIGLVAPDVDAVEARLVALQPGFDGTAFSFRRCYDPATEGDLVPALDVCCPYGNLFRIHAATPESAAPSSDGKFRCGGPTDCVGQPGAPSLLCGLQYLRLDVPSGSFAALADFWGGVLGATVQLREAAAEAASAARERTLRVYTSSGLQWLEFVEVAAADVSPWDGHHLALYLHDFERAYRACEGRGLLYDPGRFADRGGSWELACEHRQFRTLHVPPAGAALDLGLRQELPAGGAAALAADGRVAPAYSLELEIRSLAHPSCPLVVHDASAPEVAGPVV